MNGDNDMANLFERVDCAARSTEELEDCLEEYGSRRLIYPWNGFPKIGYIYRGEIKFDVPLQPSLERAWFKAHGEQSCTADELLMFEGQLLQEFITKSSEIRKLAIEHGDSRPELPDKENAYEWVQLMQHYPTKTRLLDFSKEIHFALYFALEDYCKKDHKTHREHGLFIYCFPCIDVEDPETGHDNKCPFWDDKKLGKAGKPCMNLAIGGQMKLGCMQPHKDEHELRYCQTRQKQSFGWDRAYHPNPRLSFQEGMLVYPYGTEGVKITKDGPSWFVQCLRMNQEDPFHLGSTRERLRPVVIRIPEGSVGLCLQYIQDIRGLTPEKVYLDYGRTGDRLTPD